MEELTTNRSTPSVAYQEEALPETSQEEVLSNKANPDAHEQTPPQEPPKKEHKRHDHRLLWWITIIILAIGFLWLLFWFFYLQYHESTDDAYVNGNLVNINSAIQGSVIAFYADDTDFVVEGQILVQLDATEYAVLYEKELATLASVVLQVRQLYDNVAASAAFVASKKVALALANFDYQNRKQLVDTAAVSNEDFVHSRDALLTAELNLKQAEYQYHVTTDARGNTTPELHPLIDQQKAIVRNAYYNLKHCAIYAPSTGFVAQRMVNVGQTVIPTTNLMAIIPMDYLWVDANYKETQLPYMRIGQPASVWLDLYGRGVKFDGKVLGIASGTGSVFSLIPPQNATGNWIKIVQRLPVRISLNPEQIKKYPPRLGLSAEVNVDLTNQDLPFLAVAPPAKPVAVTNVFNISFDEVDKIIEDIIQKNLKHEP